MRRLIILLSIFILQVQVVFAHLGSPGVVMEGTAGPYRLLVTVQPPDVIPGIARVKIFLQYGSANTVSLRAVYFQAGDEGAPPAEEMKRINGQELQYEGETWLMTSGSSSVQINITGSLGKGEVIVPVVAISSARKEMPASTGRILLTLGMFLFVLMVTIIGVSVSDAITLRGELVSGRRKKTRLITMCITAVVTSLLVYGGNAWWQSWANKYRKFMYRPPQATSLIDSGGLNKMTFILDTTSKHPSRFSYVVPDHGKLMHMFVMRMPAMDAFAHLHPQRLDTTTFQTTLPKLPKGRYIAFADIVYNNGFTETIKDTFDIKGNFSEVRQPDPDDAFAFAIPADLVEDPQLSDPENTIICGKPGTGVKLKDGSTMVWEGMTNKPLVSGQVYSLRFAVFTKNREPAKLDPYLGMQGHAAIVRSDGNVYIHLHPVGTFSMAAETNLVKRMADPKGIFQYPDPRKFSDSISNYIKYLSNLNDSVRERLLMQQMMGTVSSAATKEMAHNNVVEFPYSFPTPGKYRIWVQVKRRGQILTAAFDKMVE
jgi:hypothetical protein